MDPFNFKNIAPKLNANMDTDKLLAALLKAKLPEALSGLKSSQSDILPSLMAARNSSQPAKKPEQRTPPSNLESLNDTLNKKVKVESGTEASPTKSDRPLPASSNRQSIQKVLEQNLASFTLPGGLPLMGRDQSNEYLASINSKETSAEDLLKELTNNSQIKAELVKLEATAPATNGNPSANPNAKPNPNAIQIEAGNGAGAEPRAPNEATLEKSHQQEAFKIAFSTLVRQFEISWKSQLLGLYDIEKWYNTDIPFSSALSESINILLLDRLSKKLRVEQEIEALVHKAQSVFEMSHEYKVKYLEYMQNKSSPDGKLDKLKEKSKSVILERSNDGLKQNVGIKRAFQDLEGLGLLKK